MMSSQFNSRPQYGGGKSVTSRQNQEQEEIRNANAANLLLSNNTYHQQQMPTNANNHFYATPTDAYSSAESSSSTQHHSPPPPLRQSQIVRQTAAKHNRNLTIDNRQFIHQNTSPPNCETDRNRKCGTTKEQQQFTRMRRPSRSSTSRLTHLSGQSSSGGSESCVSNPSPSPDGRASCDLINGRMIVAQQGGGCMRISDDDESLYQDLNNSLHDNNIAQKQANVGRNTSILRLSGRSTATCTAGGTGTGDYGSSTGESSTSSTSTTSNCTVPFLASSSSHSAASSDAYAAIGPGVLTHNQQSKTGFMPSQSYNSFGLETMFSNNHRSHRRHHHEDGKIHQISASHHNAPPIHLLDANTIDSPLLLSTSSGTTTHNTSSSENIDGHRHHQYLFSKSTSSRKNSSSSPLNSWTYLLPWRFPCCFTTRSPIKKGYRQSLWRTLALTFVGLSMILSLTLAYFTTTYIQQLRQQQKTAEWRNGDLYASAASTKRLCSTSGVFLGSSLVDTDSSSEVRSLPPNSLSFNEIGVVDEGVRMNSGASTAAVGSTYTLPVYGYWNVQFELKQQSLIRFGMKISQGSSFAFYSRLNALPTHTNFDEVRIVKGNTDDINYNSHQNITRRDVNERFITKQIKLMMGEGHWFISIFNDYGIPQKMTLSVTKIQSAILDKSRSSMSSGVNIRTSISSSSVNSTFNLASKCFGNCSGHGKCLEGQCICNVGFTGKDCSQGICPVLCNGRGEYLGGECRCQPGFKGKECELRHSECQVADCNGHGVCQSGTCVCSSGYKGEFCEKADCIDPTCSGHGWCHSDKAECICERGWIGMTCSESDERVMNSCSWLPPDCNSVNRGGRYDVKSAKCVCADGWTGSECQSRVCHLDCGTHGTCEDNACKCDVGWSGERCATKMCDSRCEEHGQCKNGTCLCIPGWNGKHCTLEGCPKHCSNHGTCKRSSSEASAVWRCSCNISFEGLACEVPLESECDDGLDNDGDGLTDCQDPDCCLIDSNNKCGLSKSSSSLCSTVQKPLDIILRRQPPSPTASFYQKMKFLVEDGVQKYSKANVFKERLASVIRGQVVTEKGRTGVIGAHVHRVGHAHEGYTKTQKDGWFDVMVNGGGMITLEVNKVPFKPKKINLSVPTNEMIVLEPVRMELSSSSRQQQIQNHHAPVDEVCKQHDYSEMIPTVLASWRVSQHQDSVIRQDSNGNEQTSLSTINLESMALQETVRIPNTDNHLVYHSNLAKGYASTIEISLTPEKISAHLKSVTLQISIDGVIFKKVFEADPDLKYTYVWNRLNVYRQRVYGSTKAEIKVGYVYQSCPKTVWNIQTSQISAEHFDISYVGGWNFDIHHRYNFEEGILYRGNGKIEYFKDHPRVAHVFDPLKIRPSEDSVEMIKNPIAMCAASDGSFFIGDIRQIQRVEGDSITKILDLNSLMAGKTFTYTMEVDLMENVLYVADSDAYRIVRVIDSRDPKDPSQNWKLFAGSANERCFYTSDYECGDGGYAVNARLLYPRSMAISSDRNMYVADGSRIRMIDMNTGKIETLVGNDKFMEDDESSGSAGLSSPSYFMDYENGDEEMSSVNRESPKPDICGEGVNASSLQLRWPSDVAVNPLDNSIYFIDDNIVFKLTEGNKMALNVAGRQISCRENAFRQINSGKSKIANQITLLNPESISFMSNGDLLIAESDRRRINRVRIVDTGGIIDDYAGTNSKKYNEWSSATNYKFFSINDMTIGPDSAVYAVDVIKKKIVLIESVKPDQKQPSRTYVIHSSQDDEKYVFNQFGLHKETRMISSDRVKYEFHYSVSSSNGKLIGIKNLLSQQSITINRDYAENPVSINIGKMKYVDLKLNRKRQIVGFHMLQSNTSVGYGYDKNRQLIVNKKFCNHRPQIFEYNPYGRLSNILTSTGDQFSLSKDLNWKGATVELTKNSRPVMSLTIQPRSVEMSSMSSQFKTDEVIFTTKSSSFHHRLRGSLNYELHSDSNSDNQDLESFRGEVAPQLTSETASIHKRDINRLRWGTELDSTNHIVRNLVVNGRKLIETRYNRLNSIEIKRFEPELIANITFDENKAAHQNVKRTRISPSNMFTPTTLRRQNTPNTIDNVWMTGQMFLQVIYDKLNRITSVKDSNTNENMISLGYFNEKSVYPNTVSYDVFKFHVYRDHVGGIKFVQTPNGNMYTFLQTDEVGKSSTTFGQNDHSSFIRFYHGSSGNAIGVHKPDCFKNVVLYENELIHSPKMMVSGSVSMEYEYSENGQPSRIVKRDAYIGEMAVNIRYAKNFVNQITTVFVKSKLVGYKITYDYDGTSRVSTTNVTIDHDESFINNFVYNTYSGWSTEIPPATNVVRNSVKETRYVNEQSTREMSTVLDSYGRKATQSLKDMQSDNTLYSSNMVYNENGFLSKEKRLVDRKTIDIRYQYTKRGQVFSAIIDKFRTGSEKLFYNYDANGNVISVQSAKYQKVMKYDVNDRVVEVETKHGNRNSFTKRIVYDECTNAVLRNDDNVYKFNNLGQLESVVNLGNDRIPRRSQQLTLNFYYDHLSRLIAKRDALGHIIQYIYAHPTDPNLATHVHFVKSRQTSQLFYTDDGHVFKFISADNVVYDVMTDNVGSPVAVFNSDSCELIKYVSYTPYGEIIEDTNPSFEMHIGFRGGLRDRYVSLLYFKTKLSGDRAYDPTIGQWLYPNYEKVSRGFLDDLNDVFVYRFNNNNPVNTLEERFNWADDKKSLDLMSIDIPNVLASNYLNFVENDHVQSRIGISKLSASSISTQFEVGLKTQLLRYRSQLTNVIHSPHQVLRRPPSQFQTNLGFFSRSEDTLIGNELIVSTENDRNRDVVVHKVSKSVVCNIFSSLMNGSKLLDVSDVDSIYFWQPDQKSFDSDLQQVERLSGSYELKSANLEVGKRYNTICLREKKSVESGQDPKLICFVYSTGILFDAVNDAFRRSAVMKSQERLVNILKEKVDRVTAENKSSMSSNHMKAVLDNLLFDISDKMKWSDRRFNELVHKSVDRYKAFEVHDNIIELIGQPSNIAFADSNSTSKRYRMNSIRPRT